jgi:hypothetical protein
MIREKISEDLPADDADRPCVETIHRRIVEANRKAVQAMCPQTH